MPTFCLGSLQVYYYGLIRQSTGEDWTNAKLSLSTANPSIGGSVPELGEQLLKFKRAYVTKRNKRISPPMNAINSFDRDMYDPTIEDSYGDMW